MAGEAKVREQKGEAHPETFEPAIISFREGKNLSAFHLARDGRVHGLVIGARVRDQGIIEKVHGAARAHAAKKEAAKPAARKRAPRKTQPA